ncbi:cytochrome P450 4C1-like isoform X2 [Cylas formicarius]|uniref:cytochrome P450 4C1-like isoform X2 n=1 Tax=Cylas formicarius TaxID=197179 RepID=UPI0029586D11|nr:cytochrome P450 4C1-like isoform X2 [Cylas formicarius]
MVATMYQKLQFYFNIILNWKLLVCLVLLKYVLVLYRTRRLLKFSFDHNGPAYFPLVGNWYWLIGKANLSAFIDLKRRFSLPCNLWLSQTCYNYVTDVPHEVKTILTHPNSYEKATFYSNFVSDLFENSLAVDKWEKARLQRRFVSKTFSLNYLRQFTHSFHTNISTLLERVSSISTVEELIQVTSERTACSILVNIMGLKSENFVKELVYHLTCYQKCFYNKTYSRALPPRLWRRFTSQGREAVHHYSRMRDLIRTATKLRKQQIKAADDEDTEKMTFFDLHILGRSPYTENEFEDELFLLILAGISTTAVTISLALALLGMHASVQETLYEEVKRCVESETAILHEDIQELKFNEQVILETLRLFPALPFLGRYVRNDIDLGTKIIPKGSNVILPLYLIHRNEKFWPNPEKFDPDRFSSQNLANIVPGSYVPFSMGGRDCIGKTYSMIFMKMVVANVVKTFKIESNNQSVEDFKIASHIDLRPNGYIECRFIPRDMGYNK